MVQNFNYGIMIVARRLYLNPSLKGNDCTTIERDAILVRGERFGRDKGFAGVWKRVTGRPRLQVGLCTDLTL